MLKKNPKNIILYVFITLLVLIFIRFSFLISFSQSEIVLEKGELIATKNKETVQQKFISKRSNLTKVSILMRSSGIKKGDNVEATISDDSCKNPIRQGRLSESFSESENLYEFNFRTIPDSKDKIFCMQLTFKTKNPTAKPIRYFTTDDNHFPFQAENITTGEKAEGHLSIRPSFKNDHFWQNIGELNERISQYKPFFLKHYYLYFITFSFLILSIGLVVILIFL